MDFPFRTMRLSSPQLLEFGPMMALSWASPLVLPSAKESCFIQSHAQWRELWLPAAPGIKSHPPLSLFILFLMLLCFKFEELYSEPTFRPQWGFNHSRDTVRVSQTQRLVLSRIVELEMGWLGSQAMVCCKHNDWFLEGKALWHLWQLSISVV